MADHPLVERLIGWANQMSIRFAGAEVFLAGSALDSTNLCPRDIDITIVVSDHHFQSRYGVSTEDLDGWNVHRADWTPGMVRWGREVAKLAEGLQPEAYGEPVDLKVVHQSKARRHYVGKSRWRLDQVGMLPVEQEAR